ncbi:YcxB family protein [Singulisphaera rosea]
MFVYRILVRQLGALFFIMVGLMILTLAGFLWYHERGWIVGFLMATVVFVGIFLVMIYVSHFRQTIGRFRRMRTPMATMAYDEENVCLTSELGSSTIPWSSITEVWKHPRFWLLLISPSTFVTLPLDCLEEQDRDFITRKIG